MEESDTLHCLVDTEGNTRLEKTALSQYFSSHAVTERMAAPGCGSEREPGGVKLWFTNIFMVMAFRIGATQPAVLPVLTGNLPTGVSYRRLPCRYVEIQ